VDKIVNWLLVLCLKYDLCLEKRERGKGRGQGFIEMEILGDS